MKLIAIFVVALIAASAQADGGFFGGPIFTNILPGEEVEIVDTAELNNKLPIFTDLDPDESVEILPPVSELPAEEEEINTEEDEIEVTTPEAVEEEGEKEIEGGKPAEPEPSEPVVEKKEVCLACFDHILSLINAIENSV